MNMIMSNLLMDVINELADEALDEAADGEMTEAHRRHLKGLYFAGNRLAERATFEPAGEEDETDICDLPTPVPPRNEAR